MLDSDSPPQPSPLKQALVIFGLIFAIFLAIGLMVVPRMKRQFVRQTVPEAGFDCPPLVKGDPDAGEELFFNGDLGCIQCHKMGGRGGEVAPDLADVASRGNNLFLQQAILNPPPPRQPFQYFRVTLVDVEGRIHNGITPSVTEDPIQLRLTDGDLIEIAQADVDEITKQPLTAMPTNYSELLTVRQLSDLVAFLLRGPKARETLSTDQEANPDVSGGEDPTKNPGTRS